MSKSKRERKLGIVLKETIKMYTTNDQFKPESILSQQSCINLTYNASNEELTLRPRSNPGSL